MINWNETIENNVNISKMTLTSFNDVFTHRGYRPRLPRCIIVEEAQTQQTTQPKIRAN